MAVLYGNDAFSILVLPPKKRYSSFLKKIFLLQKISFKVKVLKTFKIFTICDIKRGRSLKRRVILKIRFLEEPMLFLLALIGKFRNRRNNILAESLDISIQKRLCFEFE